MTIVFIDARHTDRRLKLAAAAIAQALPADHVELHADGVVWVTLARPWWSAVTLGVWRLVAGRNALARARRMAVEIVRFCPEVRIR